MYISKFAKKVCGFTTIIATSKSECNKKVEESTVGIVEYKKGSITMGAKQNLDN